MLHLNCPHCRNPIEIVDAAAADEVFCPACGSSFRLERRQTSTTAQRPPADLRIGRFQVLDTVGVGAFGTVYRARDPGLDRVVALKVPRAGNLPVPQELDRFLREARSVAQLRHPAIVPVHEVGEQDGLPYLVSEFVQGVTLADYLTGRRPTFPEAAQLVAVVAEALQYAHDRGVVHRDVKPSNIMLDADGRPHLMDFGLAKRDAGEITMTVQGQVLGTPAYMSPEQAGGEGHRVDGRGDVYSLGVILYELLTGELPFRGNTRMLLHQVLHDDPKPPRRLNDRIPRDLETICLKCLRKEPGKRYGSAAALAADLGRFLKGEPIAARPVGMSERVAKWVKRRPAVAALLGVVILLTAAGLGGISWMYGEAVQERNTAQTEADSRQKAEEKAKERAEELRRQLANSQVLLADAAWREGNFWVAQNRLNEVPVDLRRWEWHYLKRSYAGGLFTLSGHTARVHSVCFSPDGHRLATASSDLTAKVWDARTGQELLTLQGHTTFVTSVCFSPDGHRLATGSGDPYASSDSDNPGEAKVWDARTGQQLLTLQGHTGRVNSLCFSSDGRRLATGSEVTATVWDARTEFEMVNLQGHTSWVISASFSPDGRCLATASADRSAKVWDARTGQELLTLQGHTSMVYSVCFSPDGQRLATASGVTPKVWDARTGQELLTFKGEGSGTVEYVCFSADGQRLVSTDAGGKTLVWDAQTGQRLDEVVPKNLALPTARSPDGQHFAQIDGSIVRLLRPPDAEELLIRRARTRLDADWHKEKADLQQEEQNPLATAFHLEQALAAQPADAALARQLNEVLSQAVKQQPEGAATWRRLALAQLHAG